MFVTSMDDTETLCVVKVHLLSVCTGDTRDLWAIVKYSHTKMTVLYISDW